MKKLIFSRRDASTKGVTMHFHNLTSMVLFDQVIRIEFSNGFWRIPSDQVEIWSDPNYYIVGDKTEVCTRFDYIKDSTKIKRNYNLKRILNNDLILEDCIRLGRFTKAMEVGVIKFLKFDNLRRLLSLFPDSLDKIKDFNEFKRILKGSDTSISEIIDILSYEDLEDYYKSEYYGKELKDDFGMIQNVIRTDYISDDSRKNSEIDHKVEIPNFNLGLPFDYNDDVEDYEDE